MTQRVDSSEVQSQYLALINALVESFHDLRRLGAPCDAQDRLFGVIGRCRDDYNMRFPTSALPTDGRVASV